MTAHLGPQSVQQLVIGLSTGHFPISIVFSTIVSVLTLSWGASRAFFVERVLGQADPDPAVTMVLLRVFPLMVVVVVNSMVDWIAIAGLIGVWVFPALVINFATTYSVVRTVTINVEKNSTVLKASLYSLWLPSIIGEHPKTFIISAITTLVTKLLMLIVSVLYSLSGVQLFIHPRPFLLYCVDEWDQASAGNLTLCTFSGENPTNTSCFDLNGNDTITQKLRVCDGNEWTLQISIFLTLMVTNSLSLAASLQLNRITNYVTLYKVSKSFLWHSVQQSFAKRRLPSIFLFDN